MTISDAMAMIGKKLGDRFPVRISTRDLSRNTTSVLSQIKKAGVPAVITYRGVPSFLVAPIEQDELFSLVYAASPHLFDEELRQAGAALEKRDLFSLDDVERERKMAKESY